MTSVIKINSSGQHVVELKSSNNVSSVQNIKANENNTGRISLDLSLCKKKTTYFEKDCLKFKKGGANKLISRGSPNSSSHAYAVAAGKHANTGNYTCDDIVGISAEGRRKGRIEPDFEEISKAIQANVKMFITDTAKDRNTWYNLGEQQVDEYLMKNEYQDIDGTGHWTR